MNEQKEVMGLVDRLKTMAGIGWNPITPSEVHAIAFEALSIPLDTSAIDALEARVNYGKDCANTMRKAATEITTLRTKLAGMEEAAKALQADRDSVRVQLAEARAQIKTAGEQEAVPTVWKPFQCFTTEGGDGYFFEHPADDELLFDTLWRDPVVGDEYEIEAGWYCVKARYRVIKAADNESDDVEVECISHREPIPAPNEREIKAKALEEAAKVCGDLAIRARGCAQFARADHYTVCESHIGQLAAQYRAQNGDDQPNHIGDTTRMVSMSAPALTNPEICKVTEGDKSGNLQGSSQ